MRATGDQRSADASRGAACAAHGFTLTELLVAVVVLIVIIAATSRIFGTASRVTGLGVATASVMQEAAAIERQLRADIANLSKDGFFAIRCVAVPNNIHGPSAPLLNPNLPPDAIIRADQLVFFTQGVETQNTYRFAAGSRMRGEGLVARVYWGHAFQLPNGRAYEPIGTNNQGYAHDTTTLMAPWHRGTANMRQTFFSTNSAAGNTPVFQATGSQYSINADQPPPPQWLLARQAVMLADDDVSDPDSNSKTVYMDEVMTARSIFYLPNNTGSPFGWTREVRNGRILAAASQLEDIRRWIIFPGGAPNPRAWLGATIGQQRGIISNQALYYPRAERRAPSMHRVDQALTNHVISSGCSSFIIDWTYKHGTGEVDVNGDGFIDPTVDFVGVQINPAEPQPWFGMPRLNPNDGQPDEVRGTAPFVTWGSPGSTIDPANIDSLPQVPGTLPFRDTFVYEAFFGYNHSMPLNPTNNRPWWDTAGATQSAAVINANAYTPWPSAIRVTMTLHDPEGRLEGGREFQFVIDLPER